MRPRIEVVRQPFHLPPVPPEPFVLLDVAFAGGNALVKTLDFIQASGDRLRAWVDHHEHPDGWPRFADDARFVLVSSRKAHACPELVTPEVVAAAGDVGAILAHHDFDGLMSAVKFQLQGREPYDGADEDARAADAPGRGHRSSPRGERLSAALSEAGGELDEQAFAVFYRDVAESLVTGHESLILSRMIDALVKSAVELRDRACRMAERARDEAHGVCVLRVDAQLDGRMRRAILAELESRATIGLILEGTPKRFWATAATYDDRVNMEAVAELDRGRHDFRFGPTKNADALVSRLSSEARSAAVNPRPDESIV